jgi:hypothetical protein
LAGACGISLRPSLADPLRPLLPHGDPFHEPRQVGARGDAQGRLERSARPPAVSRVLVVECQDHPGPFGEQVAAAVRDLPQLGDRGVDVERFPARVAARGAGDTGGAVTAAASSEEAATGLAAVR